MTNIIDVLSFIHKCNQEEMNQLVIAIEKRKDRFYGDRAKSIKEKKAIEWIGGRRLIKEAKFFLGDKQYQTLLEKGLVFENKEYVVVC